MIDEKDTICPICGEDNNCLHNKDCWCVEKTIAKELIEKIPIEKRGKACICKSCVEEFENIKGKRL